MSSKIVKEIIATFLKKTADSIGSSTRIDNTAITGSVLIHRMYSELSKKGFKVKNMAKIKTYGDLEAILFGDTLKNDYVENSKIDNNISIKVRNKEFSCSLIKGPFIKGSSLFE